MTHRIHTFHRDPIDSVLMENGLRIIFITPILTHIIIEIVLKG